jgi:hypothetical protein
MCYAWIFPFGTQKPGSSDHRLQGAPLIFDKPARETGEISICYLPIFILIHLSLFSGTTPHNLMLQNKTPFMAWVVGDPHFGTFT